MKNLIKFVSLESGLTMLKSKKLVKLLFSHIISSVASGNEVRITGFGKFSFSERKERNGVNPITKEKIRIPSIYTPKFTAGTDFKKSVKENRI